MKASILLVLFAAGCLLPLPLYALEDKLQRGIDLLHAGKQREALQTIEEVAIERPLDGSVQASFGYVLLRSGDYDRADRVLRGALNAGGDLGMIYRLLAEIAAQRGDFPAALEELEEALRLLPQDSELLSYKEKLNKEWQIEEKMAKNIGGNFTVTFEGGGDTLGSATLAILEDAYIDLGGKFQVWPTQKTEVILYGNRDFKSLTNAPDWSAGLYDGKIRIPIGGINDVDDNLRRILYHEYAHLLIRSLTHNRQFPLWFNEGLAEWAAGGDASPLRDRLSKGGRLIPLVRLERSFTDLTPTEVSLAYLQSLSLTSYLIERFGESEVLEILNRLGAGMNFLAASEGILAPSDGSLEGLVSEWEKSLY